MDRRQRKSRASIFSAFNTLLEKKSYRSITVQEIIDEADVGRTTFYAHFPTKDDLLRELSDEMLNHVFSPSLDKESTHDFSKDGMSYRKLVSHILYHIKDSSMNIERILSSDCSAMFLRFFRERFSSYIENMVNKDKECNVPRSYEIDMLSSGLISTIEWWVKAGMKDSPETVASYFTSLFKLQNE